MVTSRECVARDGRDGRRPPGGRTDRWRRRERPVPGVLGRVGAASGPLSLLGVLSAVCSLATSADGGPFARHAASGSRPAIDWSRAATRAVR